MELPPEIMVEKQARYIECVAQENLKLTWYLVEACKFIEAKQKAEGQKEFYIGDSVGQENVAIWWKNEKLAAEKRRQKA